MPQPPGGPGWRAVLDRARLDGDGEGLADARWNVPAGILSMVAGCFAVYSGVFGTGYWIYGNWLPGVVLTAVAAGCTAILIVTWKRVNVG